MEVLKQKSLIKINEVNTTFKRYLYYKIDWNDRLIIIKGARGVGKTTLILQHIKETFGNNENILYTSLDDIWFADNTIVSLADQFVKMGGTHLFLDEVHKYPNWAREIKNIYDDYSELKLILTSSSALQIIQGKADLSRRAVIYQFNEMSIREYLMLHYKINIPVISIKNLLERHIQTALEIRKTIKPVRIFKEFLQYGAYPYSIENKNNYYQRLINTVLLTIETDLPAILNIDYSSVVKLKRLIYVIASSSPFKPNISELSKKIGVSRDTLLRYLHYLEDAHLINLLKTEKSGMSYFAKPDKIYINSPDMLYAIDSENVNIGTLRESFFFNQLKTVKNLYYTPAGDFNVNNECIIEIGGKNKTNKQIKSIPHSYLAKDDIEIGYKNTIPLWLFGFVY